MATETASASVENAVRSVEPSARFVSGRKFEQVVETLQDQGLRIPFNLSMPVWVESATTLRRDIGPNLITNGPVLLLADPRARQVHRMSAPDQLHVYWRTLYRARILAAFDGSSVEARKAMESRLLGLRPIARRELEYVLTVEHLITRDADSGSVFRAFAAVYMDLYAFDTDRLADAFPSLPEPDEILQFFPPAVRDPELRHRCQPTGAALKGSRLTPVSEEPTPVTEASDPSSLLARANDAEARGNLVRAAILRKRAVPLTRGPIRGQTLTAARAALRTLTVNLARIFVWDDHEQERWAEALLPLLPWASRGLWPRSARCLYELQKIPADLGGEIFSIDVPEYIRSLGGRPIKRLLTTAREPMMLMCLKRAHEQLVNSRLNEADRAPLSALLHTQSERLEMQIRKSLTPIITQALDRAGLSPATAPGTGQPLRVEEVARDKLVAELLDQVCDRGRLRISDLRDAVARNRLKLADLAGPFEFIGGDALLRADTQLAYDLDGVYRRGEFYLRGIQRLSAVAFGTRIGRAITLYVALPFGGAFLVLMFGEELRHIGGKVVDFASRLLAPEPTPATEAVELALQAATSSTEPAETSHLVPIEPVIGLGIVFLLLIHVVRFRRAVASGLSIFAQLLRRVVIDLPLAVWNSAPIRALRQSTPVRLVGHYLTGAITVTAVVVVVMALLGAESGRLVRDGLIVFSVTAVVTNTRLGWLVQERTAEHLDDWWRVVRGNLLPGLLGWVLSAFRRLGDWVERRLYAVDEWLRYRSGESNWSLVLKAVTGVIWFPFAYLTRFAFYLLFEPQVNPVKHFPVVTVSHKVIWPMVPQIATLTGIAEWKVLMVVNGIPGIFGFMAWELMSNWRLYRANQPTFLAPVTIGTHGETMRGLLKPGFHSGTVPRIYGRLRSAGPGETARPHHDLEHVAVAVHRFVERELIPLLTGSQRWGGLPIRLGPVHLGCQSVSVELVASTCPDRPLVVMFENRDGQVEGSISPDGWLEGLTQAQRDVIVAGLTGLMDMAVVKRIDGEKRDFTSQKEGLLRPFEATRWLAQWQQPG